MICASCGRGKKGDNVKLIRRDDMTVALCADDASDWFRRERAFADARGEKFEPARVGGGKQ